MPLEIVLQIPYFALGAVLIITFLFKDRTRKFSVPIFVSMVLWILAIMAEDDMLDFPLLSGIFISIAALFYFLRFRLYELKRIIDWIKPILVLSIVVFEILENELVFSVIAVGLLSLYVIDKTVYTSNLNDTWKTLVIIPFLFSVISETTNRGLLWEEQKEMYERVRETEQELSRRREDLARCEADKMEIEYELNKLTEPTN